MNVLEKITIAVIAVAFVLCIIVSIVPFKCTVPNRIAAAAESISAVATSASIIILVIHNRSTTTRLDRQNREAAILSQFKILHAERQRLESDVTQMDIERSKKQTEHKGKELMGPKEKILEARRNALALRIYEVSGEMSRLLAEHKETLPELAAFMLALPLEEPDELEIKECLQAYTSCLKNVEEQRKKKLDEQLAKERKHRLLEEAYKIPVECEHFDVIKKEN